MADIEELQRLQRLLREEQRQREEAERRREEAENRALNDQRQREEAEGLARASQPQTLLQYLEACHSLSLAIQIVTDRSLTTQGDTTKPTGRIFPRRIIPWDDFATRQEGIWDKLSTSSLFSSQPSFPSQHQLEYVKSLLKPISSELGLRDFEHDVVENAVQKLVDQAFIDPLLQSSLGLQGTVTFESHTNLGTTDEDVISEPMKHMSIGHEDTSAVTSALKPPTAPKGRRRARGKGNRADQFCIYRTSDGQNVPVLAIEYKAPHKLSIDEIVTGLESEIQPERDVINKDGQGFTFAARSLAAAVVTQLFSYMIGKGIQYGYICTGQSFVFLHIPSDPATVYFSVCVPNQDVIDGDETRLHRTAVAQVFAFILQALRVGPPPLSWHDTAATLDTWAVEYDDVLRNIPATVRKEPAASPYKPQRWKGFQRSPIWTRSGCQRQGIDIGRLDDSDDESPPSPTPNQPRTNENIGLSTGPRTGASSHEKRGQYDGGSRPQTEETRQNIKSRLFCTQKCLLGLAYGGPMDKDCPNYYKHGQEHIGRLTFLRLIRDQLATDRGCNADCTPLHLSGSRGSIFKLRLSSHGYTLVAKGMESLDRVRLQHENGVYDRLKAVQGKHVAVCLGSVDLVLPYYYDSGVYMHFMFLSWAGRPLFDCVDQLDQAEVVEAVTTTFNGLHKLRVLHRDAAPRNILYNTNSSTLMVVDFERAEFRGRQPLSLLSPNQDRKRKRGNDDFARELECAVESVSRYVARFARRADTGVAGSSSGVKQHVLHNVQADLPAGKVKGHIWHCT